MKNEWQQKPKKERAQPSQGLPPFSPPSGEAAAPDASPPGEMAPKARNNGKGKPGKGRGEQPAEPCPEGTMPMADGNCVPVQ
jgi:hypothetical protein